MKVLSLVGLSVEESQQLAEPLLGCYPGGWNG
jgi:hypothetical protein